MVQPEVTVGRVASGPLASGRSLGVTGATICGSKTSVRSSDLPLWQVTVASHTADCYPQPRFIEPSPPTRRAAGSRFVSGDRRTTLSRQMHEGTEHGAYLRLRIKRLT